MSLSRRAMLVGTLSLAGATYSTAPPPDEASTSPADGFSVVTFDVPSGGSMESGSLNGSALVVGSAFRGSPPEPRAFAWLRDTFVWLTPESVPSVALAVDDQGRAVGWAAENYPSLRPVVWRDAMGGSAATDLAPLQSGGGAASAIEPDGEIYGYLQQPGSYVDLPVRFTEGDPKPLGRVGSGTPAAVNASGVVVGTASRDGSESGRTFAARWILLEIEELSTPEGTHSAAHAINDEGLVVGEIIDATGGGRGARAVIWDGGTARELTMPDGYDSSTAAGIDQAGTVVGTASLLDGSRSTGVARLP